MKHKIRHRIAAILLIVVILLGLIPAAVFAAEEGEILEPVFDPAVEEPTPDKVGTPADADLDLYGSYNLPPEDFIIYSDDGQALTREENRPRARSSLLLASSTATVGKSICVTFPAYTSPYWYCNRYYTDGTHKYGHYFYASQLSYHTINSAYAYCIEPNTSSVAGASYSSYNADEASSDSYWMKELDATQRSHIQKILAFGYPACDYGYSVQAQYAATQILIWEVIMRQRYSDINQSSDYGLYYAVKATLGNDLYYPYMAILSAISSGISNGKVPSFAGASRSSPTTVNLTLNESTNCYEASVTDTNDVLSYFTFDQTDVTFTKSGNTLKISVPAALIDSVSGKTITGTSSQKNMTTSNPSIWENSTYQTVLTSGSADYMKAYIKLTVTDQRITGKIQLTKYATNSILGAQQPEKGAAFHVWLKSAGSYDEAASSEKCLITVDENGVGLSEDLPYGTYCIQQVSGWTGYDLDSTVYEVRISENGKTVTVDTNGNKLEIHNEIWKGRLDIVKVDKDTKEPLANAQFTLIGSDGSMQTSVTGGNGKAIFENLVYGITYTWTETKAPHGYLLDEKNTGTWTVGKHDDSITITCEDQRRPGGIAVLKQNMDGNPLSGCTFLLEYYDGTEWKPVVSRTNNVIAKDCTSTPGITDGCITTSAAGTVSFDGLWADGETKYRLTEVAAPDGYELLKAPVFEGVLPLEADANKVTETPDEVKGNTAYFYTLNMTVRNGKSYMLPMTGGRNFPFIPLALCILMTGAGMYVYHWRRYLIRRAKFIIKNLY